jgi:antitoxin CptB
MNLSQLRWACRRGMLELDILLGNFLEQAFPALPPDEQVLFIRLLEVNDQDLFLWLTGKALAADPEMNFIVKKVRDYARDHPSTRSF